jgi:hypothetical protein
VTTVHASDTWAPGNARQAALDRDSLHDQPVCALTGWRVAGIPCTGVLDVHHRMLKGIGGTSRPWRDWLPRLITLCRAHHTWVHDKERRLAELAGIIVRRGDGDPARLTAAPVRYALSATRWAYLTTAGSAVDCPPPSGVPEGFAA